MMPPGELAVAVPVRDEAERLPSLLRALAAQVGAPPFTLCLHLDNCRDGSAGVVAAMAPSLPFAIRTGQCHRGLAPNAGQARRAATALAATVAPGGVLLTTDADSQPAPDWIAATLAGLAKADIVASRIERGTGPASAEQDRVERYYHGLHAARRRLDPVPWEATATHHWTSGASLALRAADYGALGGFAPVPSGEDAALADAAARAGLRLRRDGAVVVRTSARRLGRARHGFAATLAALDEGQLPLVHHPDDELWRYGRHAEARRLHGSGRFDALAATLALPRDEVERVAAECVNAEAFAARIVGVPPAGMRLVTLPHAELLLAADGVELEGVA